MLKKSIREVYISSGDWKNEKDEVWNIVCARRRAS
jgi:hypothetical protein